MMTERETRQVNFSVEWLFILFYYAGTPTYPGNYEPLRIARRQQDRHRDPPLLVDVQMVRSRV